MQGPIDNFFCTLPEPYQSTLFFLKTNLIAQGLTEERKWNTPFYYYKNKWFAFISYNPKNHEIYISFVKGFKVKHPKLLSEGRKQQKIYRINPHEDINAKELIEIIELLKNQH